MRRLRSIKTVVAFHSSFFLSNYLITLGLEGALDLKLPDESIDNSFKKWGIQPITKRDVLERRCTFAQTGEDFTVQHWYNCYTCGLKWDRGKNYVVFDFPDYFFRHQNFVETF